MGAQIVFAQNQHVSKYDYDEVRYCCFLAAGHGFAYACWSAWRRSDQAAVLQVGPAVVHKKCFA